ncbi:hypothetical protein BG846_01522 [Streptomyces fradiae ATCC 10745 = DSM 40063]|uniref:Uncharacterized protein n=1 Tax=Streptomyces fradiae ATCC 10745 = DSM 40063 TaxID=1319510 RepID=A0A1Y2P0M4_STRFR|nr:hypothetical protein BG846_01522 [Streptomyces fradiae ATCC 10745 = DSM 40063]
MAGSRTAAWAIRAWHTVPARPPASRAGARCTSSTWSPFSRRSSAGAVASPVARSSGAAVRNTASATSGGHEQATGPNPVVPERLSVSQRNTIWSAGLS